MEPLQNMTSLLKASKDLEISPDKCRYWLSLLEAKTEKIGKVRFVNDENVRHLQQMARMVVDGITPGESAKRIKTGPVNVSPVPVKITATGLDVTCLMGKMESMEKAIMLLVESNKSIIEENRYLQSEVSTLRKALEYRQPEAMPVTAVSVARMNTEKEEPPAPIRVNVMEPTQRKVGFWESVELWFGMLLGQG